MDKSLKIILYIIVGVLCLNVFFMVFGNSNVKSIRKDLEHAKQSADAALNELKVSKEKLDSIRNDIVVFKAYINSIQKTVALDDAEKRLKEEKNTGRAKEIKNSILVLRETLKYDSLPPIDELPVKKTN
ncbi:MAG: hypothetical protein INR73_06580 [Williamsia sp.]|nr:hypothetical protein [Williamsia sp.]